MIRFEDEARLRSIFLHSADVAPDRVSAYIKELAEKGYRDTQRQVFRAFVPLTNYLAKDYVDFAIDYLVVKPEKPRGSLKGIPAEEGNLGIHEEAGFFPCNPLNGPFLYLLGVNEDEGLRLVHTLSNIASAKWRQRIQNSSYISPGRTPLPVTINLPSGSFEFWGDDQVYHWFRSEHNCPEAVTCALMALRLWIGEQIEQGRNAEELFAKVLIGSNCVAALGACLSVAYAYPYECLAAALPLVSSPVVWLMDINNCFYDMRHSIIEIQRKATQELQEIRQFVPYYILSDDDSLREPFQRAISKFTAELPFFYSQQSSDPGESDRLREHMENFQVYGDPANYVVQKTENGILFEIKPPDHIEIRNEAALAPVNARLALYQLEMWAQRTIEEGVVAEELSLEEAVEIAKELLQPNDFSEPYYAGAGQDSSRLQFIAGAAAAAILVEFNWAKEQNAISWCRDILLAAARMPYAEDHIYSRETIFPSDPKVTAGLGLGALVKHRLADQNVREALLTLVTDTHLQVVEAVFAGLHEAWPVDPYLCWNALGLGLSLSLLPRDLAPLDYADSRKPDEAKWAQDLFDSYSRSLKENVEPDIPRIQFQEEVIFLKDLAERILGALPLSEVTLHKAHLLQIMDDLLAWTVKKNSLRNVQPPINWNHFFMAWAAKLACSLSPEEVRTHIISPILEAWPHANRIVSDFLYGYIKYHLRRDTPTTEVKRQWEELCTRVLSNAQFVTEVEQGYLRNDVSETVALMVFVRYGQAVVENDWVHIEQFSGIIERWVDVVGHNPHAYPYLLTMLDGPGRRFVPERSLDWLSRILSKISADSDFWLERRNGERTAEYLLKMWMDHKRQIFEKEINKRRYSNLVDSLVGKGITLASLLQQKLEGRSQSISQR